MIPTTACPERVDLLALAAGWAPSSDLGSHVESCPDCRKRVRRLEAEIGGLRSSVSGLDRPPPAEPPRNDPESEGRRRPIADR